MPYELKMIIRIPVPSEWGKDLWIDIRNPKMMDFGEAQQLADVRRRTKEKGYTDQEDNKDLMSVLIADWNLPPKDGSKPIADLPQNGGLNQVPAALISEVVVSYLTQNGATVEEPDPNS